MASAKCIVCGKTAYAAEQIRPVDDIVFHKNCFRCTHCNSVLKLGNYASLDGKYYCKPHFKQLFALKGNYNEGFGTEKHSAQWNHKDGDIKPQETIAVENKATNVVEIVPRKEDPTTKKEVASKKEEPKITKKEDSPQWKGAVVSKQEQKFDLPIKKEVVPRQEVAKITKKEEIPIKKEAVVSKQGEPTITKKEETPIKKDEEVSKQGELKITKKEEIPTKKEVAVSKQEPIITKEEEIPTKKEVVLTKEEPKVIKKEEPPLPQKETTYNQDTARIAAITELESKVDKMMNRLKDRKLKISQLQKDIEQLG